MKLFTVGAVTMWLVGTAGAAMAQTPSLPIPTQNGSGDLLNRYPAGTQVYPRGIITSPGGSTVFPSVTVPRGDGTTTFYYPDGTRLTTGTRSISPSGTYISPSGANGGVRIPTLPRPTQRLRQ